MENERSTAISPSETTEETVSLSDRFGLWIGFHSIDQDTYLAMIDEYVKFYNIQAVDIDVRHEALAWSVGRGSRSGRVAWQIYHRPCGPHQNPVERQINPAKQAYDYEASRIQWLPGFSYFKMKLRISTRPVIPTAPIV